MRYSVPHELTDTRVWARFHGDDLVVTAVGTDGTAAEVARHPRGTPGSPVIAACSSMNHPLVVVSTAPTDRQVRM